MGALLPAIGFAVLALVMALALSRLLIAKGPRDHPDGGRKTQAEAMPTSGGIAVFISVLPLSLALIFVQTDWFSISYLALFFGAFYMFLMGVWDDLRGLPAWPKLAAQIAIALGIGVFGVRVEYIDLGRHLFEIGFVFGLIGSAAWLVVVTNAVNFMDGSDGLAMGSSAVIAAGLALLAYLTGAYDIAALALVLLGGLLGLLVWNGRGKLFAGDSGSLFVGFYLAALSLLWISRLEASVWIAPALFIGFLTDVLLTIIWRYRHGRKLIQPHREHVYQLMIRAVTSHALTAWIFAWIAMHGVLVAGVSFAFPRGAAMLGFLLLLGILFLLSQRIRRSAINNGLLDPGSTL